MVINQGKKKIHMEGELSVVYFREGDAFIAYTPALDLSSYGATLDEARKNISEAVAVFIQDVVERGTIEAVLEECGWQRISRPHVHWVPPAFICQESLPLSEQCLS